MTAITTHTETHALVASTPQSYGSITPQFNKLDVFIDFNNQFGNIFVEVFIQGGGGGVNTRVARQLIGRNKPTDPNQAIAILGIGIQGSTNYSVQLTSDSAMPGIKASFAGYDPIVNDTPPEATTNSHPLVVGTEVSFGLLAAYHVFVQVDVDFGPNNTNTESIFRLYGICGAGGVRTQLFSKRLSANPNGSGRVQTVIQLPDDFQAVGCDAYEITLQAVNPITGADSSPTVSLIGFSPNLTVATAGGPPTGPAGGYLGGNYPNPTIVASPTLVYDSANPSVANRYQTWAALYAAFLLTIGSVVIEVAPGTHNVPAGIWDLQGRASVISELTDFSGTTLNLLDGAQLKTPTLSTALSELNITCNSLIGSPYPILFDTTVDDFINFAGTNILQHGAKPCISFTGAFGGIFFTTCSLTTSGAGRGEIIEIPNGATCVVLMLASFSPPTIGGANSFIKGAVGTSLLYEVDSSFGPTLPSSPTFLGTLLAPVQISKNSKTQSFLADGNFTVPVGVTEVDLECTPNGGGGAGGHGGQVVVNGTGGGGGAAGAIQKRTIRGLTQLAVIAIAGLTGGGGTAGAGGAAGAVGTNGTQGLPITFGALATFDPASGGKGATVGNASGGAPYVNNAGNMFDAVGGSAGNASPSIQGAGGRGGADGTVAFAGARNGGFAVAGNPGAEGVGAGATGHGGGGGGAGANGAGGNGGDGGATLAPGGNAPAVGANTGAGGGGGGGGGDAGQIGGNGAAGGTGKLLVTWRLSP